MNPQSPQPTQDPIQAAMARRQATPQAPQMPQGGMQAPMQPQAPTPESTGPVTPHAPSQKWQPQNQSDMIISALISQLESSAKLQKEQMTMQSPAMPTPTQQMPTTPSLADPSSSMATSQKQSDYPLSPM